MAEISQAQVRAVTLLKKSKKQTKKQQNPTFLQERFLLFSVFWGFLVGW